MNNDIEKVLYSEEDIQAAIARLAKQVAADYQDKDPLIVSVLSGAVLFTVDLIKKMDIMAQLDFIDVSTYFGGTATTGHLKLIHDLTTDVKDRNVLITEDIVDSGRTLEYLVKLFKDRGAKSVKTVSLLNNLKDAVALADAPDMYAFFQKVSNYLQGKLWKFLI